MEYKVREEVKKLEKYVAGKPIDEVKREYGIDKVVKLASNENPLGTSEKVKSLIMDLVNEMNMYPDASSFDFKEALSKKIGVNRDMIFCGAGSDSLINVICEVFLDKEDESIMAEITFPRYESNTKLLGAKAVKVPLKNNGLDLEAMVDAINEKTKIIWFCNPNNPTGGIFTKTELDNVLNRIPKDVIIVMDEAYGEYVTSEDYPDSLDLIKTYPNMIVLKTLSKAYGLASLRFGYGIANEEIVDYMNRVINSFDVNLFAQKAAVVSIEDEDFVNRVRNFNKEQREFLSSEFDKMKLKYIKSEANFIMVNVNGDDKPIHEYLLKHGYIIRPGFLLDMPGWIRVSLGTKEQNIEFCKLLREAIEDRDSK
ncbi:MAG: histidinol-phosphate transaminase [Clostridium sartagoforme]|nr:histidinol-phosphate transaminase [Clostridium sartagoforme]